MKPKLLISACLCGKNTKYNGGNNLIEHLKELEEQFELVLICPEVMGGLATPRVPSEIVGEKVLSKEGRDVTEAFQRGAIESLKIAKTHNITLALLKEASPSCGVHKIYDGTFCGHKVDGTGMTTRILMDNNIKVFCENEIVEILELAKTI